LLAVQKIAPTCGYTNSPLINTIAYYFSIHIHEILS
jgi:hypothetical protein